MPIGILFWVLMVIWFVFGLWVNWPPPGNTNGWRPVAGNLFLFVLLFLLGWKVFGFVVQG